MDLPYRSGMGDTPHKKVTIPGNIRTVIFRLVCSGLRRKATIDDLFFSAEVAKAFDVDVR